ncbi:MAG: prolyl oligopeptidase family serine peptidase [Bacteroidales bacterium]|nr:prolyl oligopeptidase family serine peptidase [Bacteroidales bacterium]
MKKIIAFILIIILPGLLIFAQENSKVPSFEEVLSLKGAGTPIISPDGKHIVFTVRQTDWENNRVDTEIWISKNGGTPFQLTNNQESNSTGISLPGPPPAYVYPILQWLDKGALVLMPNYRGSAGYGEDFRKMNVENLGVGDAWDVMSGIEYLDAQGIIDTDRMGAMGWSQGGYISAFLTTNTNSFKAISVGAGISNWMTYHVNTDIHPFT